MYCLRFLFVCSMGHAGNVFIHDAARPNFYIDLLKKLKSKINKYKAVVPFINTNNSTKYSYKNKVINLDREKVFLTQTPQCFDFKILYNSIFCLFIFTKTLLYKIKLFKTKVCY